MRVSPVFVGSTDLPSRMMLAVLLVIGSARLRLIWLEALSSALLVTRQPHAHGLAVMGGEPCPQF